jgi:hypothetical protein
MKTLKLIFPGQRYSCDRSLLYFIDTNIEGESVYFKYDFARNVDLKSITDEEIIERAIDYSKQIINHIDFSEYDEIIFIAKSVGTYVAGYFRDELKLNSARFICLTPITKSLKFIRQNDFVITGSLDKRVDPKELEKFKYAYPFFETIEGVGHSLEYRDNLKATFDIQYKVCELALNYLDTANKDILG